VPLHTTYIPFRNAIADLGATALCDVVGDLRGYRSSAISQKQIAQQELLQPNAIRRAKKVHPKLAVLDFDNMDAMRVYGIWRAFHGYFPSPAVTSFNGTRVVLLEVQLDDTGTVSQYAPGTFHFDNARDIIWITCQGGSRIGKLSMLCWNCRATAFRVD